MSTAQRLPVMYVGHGGGPWPWLDGYRLGPLDHSDMRRSLLRLSEQVGVRPRAVLVITAHWEQPAFTVQTSPAPGMVYDYGGFPPHTYTVTYPAPGEPDVAARVVALLQGAGNQVAEDAERGFDHGTFVPLAVAWPAADVPVVQLSIKQGYDPDEHLAVGRALAPLRDEGVFVMGSGSSDHNTHGFRPDHLARSQEFDDWLHATLVDSSPRQREQRLRDWETAPSARRVHPEEDHLIPLMVVTGAAGHDAAVRTWSQRDFGGLFAQSTYRFGLPVVADEVTLPAQRDRQPDQAR